MVFNRKKQPTVLWTLATEALRALTYNNSVEINKKPSVTSNQEFWHQSTVLWQLKIQFGQLFREAGVAPSSVHSEAHLVEQKINKISKIQNNK